MFKTLARSLAITIAAALIALQSAGAARAAEIDDLVGDWTVALMIPSAPALATLKVEKGEKGLIAILNSQLGESKIEDIDLIDGKHVMLYMMDLGGNPTDIEVTAEVKGEALTGEVIVGGGAMQLDIKGGKVGTEAEKALKEEVEKAQAAPAEADAPSLPVADAKDFVGEWIINLNTPGGEAYVPFNVIDVDGKAQAKLELPQPMEPQTINKITKTDTGLRLDYDLSFGAQTMKLAMNVKKTPEGALEGQIADEQGLFTMDFKGLDKKAAETAGWPTTASAPEPGQGGAPAAQGAPAAEGGGQGGGQGGGRRQRAARGASSLDLKGKKVSISYGRPTTAGAGYKQLSAGVAEGTIWRMGSNNATKLTTETDLRFGNVTLKAGSYSLWAKRVGQGWHLVFNSKADVWGTQHDPSADLGSVAFESSKLDAPVESLTIDLKPEGDGGKLVLSWGTDSGSVSFAPAS